MALRILILSWNVILSNAKKCECDSSRNKVWNYPASIEFWKVSESGFSKKKLFNPPRPPAPLESWLCMQIFRLGRNVIWSRVFDIISLLKFSPFPLSPLSSIQRYVFIKLKWKGKWINCWCIFWGGAGFLDMVASLSVNLPLINIYKKNAARSARRSASLLFCIKLHQEDKNSFFRATKTKVRNLELINHVCRYWHFYSCIEEANL